MITSFKKVIESEGFEPMKKVACDKWLGDINSQYHVTALMDMGDNTRCIWYGEYYDGWYFDGTQTGLNSCKLIEWSDTANIIWASSKEEMEIDRKFLKSQAQAKKHNDTEQCLLYLKQFVDKYEGLDDVSDVIKHIREDKRFQNFRDKMKYYWCEPDDVDEDVQYEIARIFRSHMVTVCNKYTDKISVRVNLDNAHTVKQCQLDGKDAICISMGGDENYYLFCEDDEDNYKALCVLYGYDI